MGFAPFNPSYLFIVMPGLVPGIHVDGRNKPAHDGF